jgi:hypothetical protein
VSDKTVLKVLNKWIETLREQMNDKEDQKEPEPANDEINETEPVNEE